MKPIWYFVGLLLAVVGALILITGIYEFIRPPARQTIMYELHSAVWWGAIMLVIGLLFFLKNRAAKIE